MNPRGNVPQWQPTPSAYVPPRIQVQRPVQQPPLRQSADCWLPDGVRVEVAGLSISGGMLCVGSHLKPTE